MLFLFLSCERRQNLLANSRRFLSFWIYKFLKPHHLVPKLISCFDVNTHSPVKSRGYSTNLINELRAHEISQEGVHYTLIDTSWFDFLSLSCRFFWFQNLHNPSMFVKMIKSTQIALFLI